MSFNKIIIVGNLGRDPDLRYTPQGVAVCSFTMATNEKRKDSTGDRVDVVTWFKITLWRQQAENAAKYLTKGSPVYIEGRLKIEEWTDRENNNRYTLDVQASDMQFISAGSGSSSSDDRNAGQGVTRGEQGSLPEYSGPAASTGSTSAPVRAPIDVDDDIPF